MAPRPGLTLEKVTDAAAELIEQEGLENLSLASLAKHFGVKTPSLYNHVDGIEGLRRTLRLRGLEELGTRLQRAAMGRSSRDALVALSQAYREFAQEQPGLYALTLQISEQDDEEIKRASSQVVEVVLAVSSAYELEDNDALHATRCLRSALHGFVSLETMGGFGLPLEINDTFERLVELLHKDLLDSFPPVVANES